MTDTGNALPEIGRARPRHGVSGGILGLGTFFCFLLLLRNPGYAAESMARGLRLCAEKVVPSLFPFLVLSELTVRGRLGDRLFERVSTPLRRLFRLPAAGIRALLLGFLCGFPVGAKCAVLAFDAGELDREQTERALAVSACPSPAFLIGTVGVSMRKSRAEGAALCVAVLFSSVLTGLILARLPRVKRPSPAPSVSASFSRTRPGGAKLFCDSVAASAQNMLLICAYVVFFSAFSGTVDLVLTAAELPRILPLFSSVLLELTGGVKRAAELSDRFLSLFLCGAAAGWSGLSVHCQILSVTEGRGLNYRIYFLSKAAQSLLTAALLALFCFTFPSLFAL